MLDHCEDKVLSAVVPVLRHFLSQVQLPSFFIHHRVEDLADEGYLRRFSGEVLEGHFELELCVLKESVPDEKNPMPNYSYYC